MILNCYAVMDRSAAFFFPPFFLRSDVEAKRTFERMMADPQRSGAKSEYALYSVGKFDDATGVLYSDVQVPTFLMSGDAILNGEANANPNGV